MMIVGMARYIVVSGFSTFATAAFELFPGRRRIMFNYFCNKRVPHESPLGLEICVDGDTKGLVPWNYTIGTRQIMMERPSQVVWGNTTAAAFPEYLEQRLP
jgi:hypothetical protein